MKKLATRTLASYWHTPAPNANERHLFHSVLRAGRLRLALDFPLESWAYPGHDLILSLRGSGSVRIGNRQWKIRAAEVVWIDYNYHHSPVRWPNRTEPWEILYVRVNSPQMDQIARVLAVENNPLFTVFKPAKALADINAIFKLLRDRPIAMEAMLHAAVSSLIAILFEARQASLLGHLTEQAESRAAANLAKVLSVMRQEYDRRWKAPELARLMGTSVPQFYRRFTLAMGTAPMAWLRRERVNHAKRRLIETDERIREIANAVGYADALHFSRDFCRMVGVSPRNYRARERVDPTSLAEG